MGRQTFQDESNFKHEPNSKHYVDDKFQKGTTTRNWKKNIDPTTDEIKTEKEENSNDNNEDLDSPPGSPSNVPIENPDDEVPMGDPQTSSQKKKRLK